MSSLNYPYDVEFGTLYWKERAAELHMKGLCIYCGKTNTPTVFDLYCDKCKSIRAKVRKVKTNE